MIRESNVILVEDDFYARSIMELLLRRDLRTRVIEQASNPADLSRALKEISEASQQVDLVLIDTAVLAYLERMIAVFHDMQRCRGKAIKHRPQEVELRQWVAGALDKQHRHFDVGQMLRPFDAPRSGF